VLVKRALFLLNAAFAIAILDLISQVHNSMSTAKNQVEHTNRYARNTLLKPLLFIKDIHLIQHGTLITSRKLAPTLCADL